MIKYTVNQSLKNIYILIARISIFADKSLISIKRKYILNISLSFSYTLSRFTLFFFFLFFLIIFVALVTRDTSVIISGSNWYFDTNPDPFMLNNEN